MVEQAAEILDLTEHLDRKPANLSGGQRQRVAMGRAIVREPEAFLMDEPLSNLDAKLRVQMRAEISRLQNRLETTTVYVTHDQTEAMTLGDRVAVMRNGRAAAGRQPAGALRPPGQPVRRRLHRLAVDELHAGRGFRADREAPARRGRDLRRRPRERSRVTPPKNLIVGIRPEHFEDSNLVGDQPGPRFEVEVTVLESMGSELYVYFDTDAKVRSEQLDELAADTGAETSGESGQIVARLDATSGAKRGEKVELWMDSSKLHFFDLDSGERITAGD